MHTYTHTHTRARSCENNRSNKDSGQIERNKLKYLHYLHKMRDEEVHFG